MPSPKKKCSHFKASWDNHLSCRLCRSCSKSKPCSVCAEWSIETWAKLQKAILNKHKRRMAKRVSSCVSGSASQESEIESVVSGSAVHTPGRRGEESEGEISFRRETELLQEGGQDEGQVAPGATGTTGGADVSLREVAACPPCTDAPGLLGTSDLASQRALTNLLLSGQPLSGQINPPNLSGQPLSGQDLSLGAPHQGVPGPVPSAGQNLSG